MAGANELIAIELQLKGYEGVMADFRALDQMLNGFRGRKNKITIQSDLAKTKKEIIALQGELNKLKQLQYDLGNKGIKSEGLDNKIKETTQRLREAQQAVREFQYALRNLSSQSFKQTFNKISSAVAHIGSAMQSAGNALTRLTNPFANFTKGIVMGAGYQALNKFTQGLENGFNRYDTMKKYPKIMAAFGYSNEEAQKSIDALDKSVRGLPTGLDEMVDLAQRFTATTGDIEKGTKLAIAANNAFLASMSTDTQKYQGMMQLQDVLGGKDMNAREWNSLVSSMTPAIVKMGESLGYTSKNMNEWIQQVRDGKVDNQKFVDTLIEIGNEGGVLQAMANESKDTWQAFFANVGNAASRMTAGLIKSMDEVVKTLNLKDKDGLAIESVNRLLSDRMIPAIDNMTASLKAWIQAHPEEITDFFESLAKINWQSLLKGVGEGILSVANLVKRFADAFGGRDLSRIGRWMIQGNILGNGLTILGGLLKGTRHIIGGFGATLFHGGRALYNIRKYGLMGYLGRVLTVGEGGAGEEAMETATKTIPKMGKLTSGLSKFFVGWAEIATMVGGTAFVTWGSMKLFKNAVKEFGEMVEIIKGIDWDTGAEAIIGLGGFLTAVGGLSALAGGNLAAGIELLKGEVIVGAFTSLALAFADLDMHLLKGSFKSFSDAIGYLKKGIDDLNSIGIIGDISKTRVRVKQAIDTFNDVIGLFENEGNGSKADDAQGKTGGKKLKALSKGTVKTVENLSTVLESMKGSIDAINEISHMKVNIGGVTSIMPKISTALIAIGQALTDIPINLTSEANAKEFANMSTSLNNAKEGFKALVGRDGLIAQIPQIIQAVAKLQRSGDFEAFSDKMQDLGGAIDNILNAMDVGSYDTSKMSTDISNIMSSLNNVQSILKKLKKLGKEKIDTAGTDNIKTIIDNIKTAFDDAHASELSGQIMVFVTAIEAALQEFEKFNEPIEITPTIELGSGFQRSVNQTTRKISSAKGQIQSAMDSIPSTFTKHVSVNVVAHVAVTGLGKGAVGTLASGVNSAADKIKKSLIGGATGGQISRQGVLYRSGGGSIFKPRGVDTIPAMLTQGEYVHKKQAVDYFGVDFMRKVNNMDVRGAMQSLLTKAGSGTNIGRQSIVNNTVNNNQRVTQNISTNNPNFTRVQMGRFAGAL